MRVLGWTGENRRCCRFYRLETEWGAGGIDDRGWDEFDVVVVDEDFPAGVVHVPMVRFAEQDAIFDAGFTIVDPVPRVVRLTHSRWPIAPRKSTSAIPRH